jgi:Fe-S cluster assembly scaffold protein SufB
MSGIPALLTDFIADARSLREDWRYTNVAEFSALTPQTAPLQCHTFDADALLVDDTTSAGDIMLRRQHFTVAAGITLRHVRVTNHDTAHSAFLQTQVDVAAGGSYELYILTNGAHRLRQQVTVNLNAPAARARIGCAYVLTGAAHHDLNVQMNHLAPACTSQQLVKGVVAGTARAAFVGKIAVAAEAQETDAQQLHKAMLLSPRAEVNAKPELEIFADQVKCTHGNAIGDLDDAALFFLRQRGLDTAAARALLVGAFVLETLEYAPADQRARLEQALEHMVAGLA